MGKKLRVRPSEGQSIIGLIGGIIFIIIGLVIVMPTMGFFGVMWTLMAVVITIIHGANVFSDKGVATEIIEISDDEHFKDNSYEDNEYGFDEKLRKLEDLKAEGLLTETEYQKKRQEMLEEKW